MMRSRSWNSLNIISRRMATRWRRRPMGWRPLRLPGSSLPTWFCWISWCPRWMVLKPVDFYAIFRIFRKHLSFFSPPARKNIQKLLHLMLVPTTTLQNPSNPGHWWAALMRFSDETWRRMLLRVQLILVISRLTGQAIQ